MSATLQNQFVPADVLTFDAILSARVSPVIDVTEHPVEDGQDVADHAQVRSLPMTITGIITATPLSIKPAVAPLEAAKSWFERNQGRLLTVIIPGAGIFSNCLLTRWGYVVDGLQRLVFDVGLKQVRLATPVSVLIAPRLPAPQVQVGAASAQDVGGQSTSAASAPAAGTDASILVTFF